MLTCDLAATPADAAMHQKLETQLRRSQPASALASADLLRGNYACT